MTDAQLRDAAVAELKKTTVGYVNKKWKVPPVGSQWKKGLDLLAQIGQAETDSLTAITDFSGVLGTGQPVSAINKCRPLAGYWPTGNPYSDQGDPCQIPWPSGGGIFEEAALAHGSGFRFLVNTGAANNEQKSDSSPAPYGRKMCFLHDANHWLPYSNFLNRWTEFKFWCYFPSSGNPSGFVNYNSWNVLLEAHGGSNPPCQIGINGEVSPPQFYCSAQPSSPTYKLGPVLTYDTWYYHRWRAKWSTTTAGVLEWWVGRESDPVVQYSAQSGIQTCFVGETPDMNLGFYSAVGDTSGGQARKISEVWYSGLRVGTYS